MGILATGFRSASLQEQRAERMQGHVRIPAAILMSIYAICASLLVTEPAHIESWARTLLATYAVYGIVALILLWFIKHFPGHYPVRRIFAMLCDFSAAGFSIIAGCTVMLPTYVFIVWIALGNGLRYGRLYLIIASVMAQMCLGIIFLSTPHWRADPVLTATLSITAFVVPAFAYSLLRAKENAEKATQDAIKAKARFLAQASHDLRQPIHAMNLFLSGLKQTPMTSAQDLLVTRLDRSLEGVAALFRSLLDISSIDGGALKPQLASVPIQRLFDDIRQQFLATPAVNTPNIRIVPTCLWVHTDPVFLTTMIQNLMTNAIRHADGRDVLLGCRRKNGRISIVVYDRGPGIDPRHLPHLFEEFYQVRKLPQSERVGGGLGLAIVQRLANMLEIQPEIKSVPGRGTSVWLHGLDHVRPADDELPFERQTRLVRMPLNDMRVLLVEDDREILAMTADLLRSWGCRIEAYAEIPMDPQPCDLIVTDYEIGIGKTALDVIRMAREVSGREIPAIIVTGHDEVAISQQFLGKGELVLRKPVKPAELRSAISTLRLSALR